MGARCGEGVKGAESVVEGGVKEAGGGCGVVVGVGLGSWDWWCRGGVTGTGGSVLWEAGEHDSWLCFFVRLPSTGCALLKTR